MKQALLSELFGGEKRFALLRALYLNPHRQFTASELVKLSNSNSGNINRWLTRWAELGLVERSEELRNILYRASNDPLLSGLTDIVRRNDEVMADIRDALPAEVEIAVVFGSVARGEEKATSDIDVLVLGAELSELRVNAQLRPVCRKHHREINATVFSRPEFEQLLKDENSFAVSVVNQKIVPLKGEFVYANSGPVSVDARGANNGSTGANA